MRWECAIVSVLPLVTFFIFHDKKDLFGPKNIFSILYIFGIVIPILFYSDPSKCINVGNAFLFDAISNDDVFFKYVVLQTLAYHCVMAGIGFASQKQTALESDSAITPMQVSSYRPWGYLFIVVGFLAFVLMMSKVGGFSYFISHLQSRTYLVRDLDTLSWMLSLAQYGCLLLVASRITEAKPITASLIIVVVIVGLMCGLGGRKTLLILVAEVVIIYHYMIKRITLSNFINPRNITALVAILVFFLVFSDLRTEGAFEQLTNDPLSFVSGSFAGLTGSLVGESYVPFYVEVVSYFDANDFWGGLSFLGLFTAFVPSGIFADKPPVDDGTYLYSICQGRSDIVPPMPFNQLNGSSFPLETFGSMYANFGIVGLIIGMIALGIVYGLVYEKMKTSSYSLLWTIMYLQVIMTFQFSTLRIFQLLECFVLLTVVIKISEFVLLKREQVVRA